MTEDSFKNWLENKVMARTSKEYIYWIERIESKLEKEILSISKSDMDKFFAETKYAPSSINYILASLKKYIYWKHYKKQKVNLDYQDLEDLREFHSAKYIAKEIISPSKEQILELLKHIKYINPILSHRDRLIILFLANLGERRMELKEALFKDIQPNHDKNNKITDYSLWLLGKGGEKEPVALSKELYNEYIQYRTSAGLNSDFEYLFANKDGLPISDDTIYNAVRMPSIKGNIKVRGEYLRPHLLRHFHATEIARLTEDGLQVMRALRHKSYNTSMRYIHLTKELVRGGGITMKEAEKK